MGTKRLEAPRYILEGAPVGLVSLKVDGKELVNLSSAERSGELLTKYLSNPAAAPLLKRDVTSQKSRHMPLCSGPPGYDEGLSGLG
jgi:hypothetical protein